MFAFKFEWGPLRTVGGDGRCDRFGAPHERTVAMRRRAFRPEAPDCLEGRSLLSGAAGMSAEPIFLSRRRLSKSIDHIRLEFTIFARDRGHSRYHNDERLREELRDAAVVIPYGRADGLGVTINRILDRMQEDLAADAPHAIRSAFKEVVIVTLSDVRVRVRAGDVIVH